jgi:hypothetical protein
MKQETLEEAEKEFEKLINGKGLPTKQLLEVAEHYFIVGYETAKERSYNDEEVKEIINCIMIQANETEFGSLRKFIDLQFEQFKKL